MNFTISPVQEGRCKKDREKVAGKSLWSVQEGSDSGYCRNTTTVLSLLENLMSHLDHCQDQVLRVCM